MTGRSRCESTSVSPWPGKCFTTASMPPAASPSMYAAASRPTVAGSSPKDRVLITGLRGLLLTSTTGAKFTWMPIARASTAVMRPASKARRGSPAAPNAMARGKFVAPSIRNPTPVSKSEVTSRGIFAAACRRLRSDAAASGWPSTVREYVGLSNTSGRPRRAPNTCMPPTWCSRTSAVRSSCMALSLLVYSDRNVG